MGAVLQYVQYVGHFSADGLDVGVWGVPVDTAFGRLTGIDNLLELTTDRYADVPLSVRGPGAGPEVTAGACRPTCSQWPGRPSHGKRTGR